VRRSVGGRAVTAQDGAVVDGDAAPQVAEDAQVPGREPRRRRRTRWCLLAAVVVVLVGGLVAYFVVAPTPAGIPFRGWTTKLADSAPLEADPARNGTVDGGVPYAKRFANQAQYNSGSRPVAGFYAGYSTIIDPEGAPVYTITDPKQATRAVTWMTNDGKGPEAASDANNGLQRAFENVPLPTGPNGERFEDYYHRPLQAGGPDQQLSIYVPATGQMWEMWLFTYSQERQRYEMGFGAYIPDVRTMPMAIPNGWGARATSLPLAMGIMLQSEYQQGVFRHPLEVALPVVKDGFIPPATRQDATLSTATVGGDTRDAVPEGAWFRLPAGYQVNPAKPKLWQMMVTAARDYGIIVVDGTGGTVTFSAEAPNAIGTPYSSLTTPALPDPQTPIEQNPYHGPANVLNDFPWNDLVQIAYRDAP
jgi:hypothetical protein